MQPEVHTLMALAIKAKQWVGLEAVASSARQYLAQRTVSIVTCPIPCDPEKGETERSQREESIGMAVILSSSYTITALCASNIRLWH